MRTLRAIAFYSVLVLVVVGSFVGWWISLSPLRSSGGLSGGLQEVTLDGQLIHVTVADTPAARAQGLGGRGGLAYDEGMLFVFDQDGKYSFWMKDMFFSIDMLWLDADGRIVYMAQSVSPQTYPETFTPDTPARYVLELPAGYAAANHVQVGDQVQM